MTPTEAAKAVVQELDEFGLCERVVGNGNDPIYLREPDPMNGLWPDLRIALAPEDDEVQVVLFGKTTMCRTLQLERHLTHIFKGLLNKHEGPKV
jgi:hypothetical protein